MPILFPNAGSVESSEYPNLKQHGFARSMKWQGKREINGFYEVLNSDSDSKKIFPFDFRCGVGGEFKKDGSFTIVQSVKNLEDEKELPISMGFHPYFKVPHDLKKDIKFNFAGGDFIKENIQKWAHDKYISINNPNTPMEVIIPNLGTLVFHVSKEYKKIWIWSQSGKDFICIEPVMRDPGGLIENPEKIKVGDTLSAYLSISLKE